MLKKTGKASKMEQEDQADCNSESESGQATLVVVESRQPKIPKTTKTAKKPDGAFPDLGKAEEFDTKAATKPDGEFPDLGNFVEFDTKE